MGHNGGEVEGMELSTHPRWEEFLCGWLAGFINISLTYPIHKVMFRQMLYGHSTAKAVAQLQKEGFRLLYRGVLPPLCQKSLSISIMFGSYEFYGNLIRGYYPSINNQLSKSLGAGMAGISEIIFSQPFERVQTLLQAKHYNSKFHNTYHAVRHILKHHGTLEFYRGTSPVIFRNASSNVVFFALREKAQIVLPRSDRIMTRYIIDFISGGLIGSIISTVLYPTNVIKARMQNKLGGHFESPHSVYKSLIDERGNFRHLYRGVHLNFTRSLLSWGIINASYELIKEFIDNIREL